MLMLKETKEGKARILVPAAERIYDAEVFYNPVMALNRDISVLAVRILEANSVLDALSATGIRGIRYALETPSEEIWLNDISEKAFKLMIKNVEANFNLRPIHMEKSTIFEGEKRIIVTNKDANLIMAENFRHFDFVDLDPFGSPMEFLDSALRAVKRHGVLAVTATDTGVLCGAYRNACLRKYLAEPIRGELCHEAGLRILLGVVIRYAAKYDLGAEVLLAYYKDHYFRIFLKLKSGARKADHSIKQLGYLQQEKNGKFEYSRAFLPSKKESHGPLWLGPLKDQRFVEELCKLSRNAPLGDEKKTRKFLNILMEEFDTPFFYDTHALARRNGLKVGRVAKIIEILEGKGYRATRTHFSPTAIKTEAPFDVVLRALKAPTLI
ncbi:tRNA (guanine(10)-N(2))-dimethyltransferase [Thermococcus sp.]